MRAEYQIRLTATRLYNDRGTGSLLSRRDIKVDSNEECQLFRDLRNTVRKSQLLDNLSAEILGK